MRLDQTFKKGVKGPRGRGVKGKENLNLTGVLEYSNTPN